MKINSLSIDLRNELRDVVPKQQPRRLGITRNWISFPGCTVPDVKIDPMNSPIFSKTTYLRSKRSSLSFRRLVFNCCHAT